MTPDEKFVGKLVMCVIAAVALATIIGIGVQACSTVGERVIFEQSHQYKQAVKSELGVFRAQLAEINHKLGGALDTATRENLEAQAAAIRIRISVAEEK